MTHRFTRSGLLAFLAIVIIQSSASAQTLLRWKFAQGQALNHNVSQESDTSMNVGGMMITTKMTVSMNTLWTVKGVNGQGVADIEQSFNGIKLKMNSPLFNVEYDSSSPNEPEDPIGKQIATALKPLAQAKFNLKITPRGEVQEVKASEETAKALEGGPAGAGAAPGVLSHDTLVAMIKESVIPFPEEPVQKGSTWQHKSELKAPPLGSMVNESTLTYDGPATVEGKQLEQIKITTKSTLTAANNPTVQVSIKNQSEAGVIYFDQAAGRLSHSDVTQNLIMEVMAGGQKFEQTIKTAKKAKMTANGK